MCGTCLDRDETIVVPDVRKFPGHIACDSAVLEDVVEAMEQMMEW